MLDNYRNYRIQPNWDVALREGDKCIWFHEYSTAGTIYNKLSYDGKQFSTKTNDCTFSLTSPSILKLKSETHGNEKVFQSADRIVYTEYAKTRQRSAHLSCMDIGPTGELALSSSSDKKVCLWETDTGDVRRQLEGHVGEVYSCRFFPSGLAALTAGADMQLKIWCLLTGKCAATLPPGSAGAQTGTGPSDEFEPGGHRTGILDTGIIDRGRNIVAIDRFGWLRLWDVSSQLCISAIPLSPNSVRCPRVACPIVEEACCVAVKYPNETPLPMQPGLLDEQSTWYQALETSSPKATEFGTTNTVVAVGMGSGATAQLYDLSQRSKGCLARFTLPHNTGSIESCAFPQSVNQALGQSPKVPHHETTAFTEYGLMAGGQNGELASWDIRYPNNPLMTFTGEKNAIHQLQTISTPDGRHLLVLVGRSDGRVTVYRYDPRLSNNPLDTAHSSLELTGIDCEPVKGLRVKFHPQSDQQPARLSVWTASLSGAFRYYDCLADDVAFYHD